MNDRPQRIAVDVMIVGGGMVGATLALALGGAGLEVVLIDRDDPATFLTADFDGRTSAIALGSARALRAIGAWERIAEAQPILDIRVSDGDNRGVVSGLFLHYDHRDVGTEPFGYIVENRHIRAGLYRALQALKTVRILAPARWRDLHLDRHATTVDLVDGSRVRAPLLIGADGRRSEVRRRAGIDVWQQRYPQTGIVCTIAHERPHHGVAHEQFLPSGPFAVLPMTGRRSSIVWTESDRLAPRILALDDAAFSREMRRRFGATLGHLNIIGGRWSYPLGVMHADRYTDRRLALVGDAAHAIHPIAGQGLNLGLRDVAALAESVIDARRLGLDIGAESVLARYQRWRRADNMTLAVATDGLNRLFSNDVLPIRLARDLGLGTVNRIPPLKRFFMRHAMGLVGDLPRLIHGRPL